MTENIITGKIDDEKIIIALFNFIHHIADATSVAWQKLILFISVIHYFMPK